MDLHSAIEVAQHHVLFLWGDPWETGLDCLWERGEHGLSEPKPPLSHPLQFPLSHSVQGEQLLVSHLCSHGLGQAFCSGSLSTLVGLC